MGHRKGNRIAKEGSGMEDNRKGTAKAYTITWAAIRKELLKRGFERGVNLPHIKPTGEDHRSKSGVLT